MDHDPCGAVTSVVWLGATWGGVLVLSHVAASSGRHRPPHTTGHCFYCWAPRRCRHLLLGTRYRRTRAVDALKKHWTGATWLTAGPRTAAQLLKVTPVTFIRDEQIRNTAFRKTTGQAISEGEVRAASDLTQTREDMNCHRFIYGILARLRY